MNHAPDPTRRAALRGTRSLITGGAGFIGSHIAEALIALGGRVVVLDDLSSGYEANIPAGASFIRASITDADALRDAAAGCDFVFHQAAMVSVPQSVEQPEACARINILGTEMLLEAAAAGGVRRIMFAASAAAYGNTPNLPSRESDAPDAWSPYAASKIAGEQLLKAHARSGGPSAVSLRYFNIFGPRQDPRSAYAAVISAFIDRLSSGRPVSIFGDGAQTRDFTYIDNVVHANLLAAASPRDLRGEIVNIGTGRRISLLELESNLRAIFGVTEGPSHVAPRPGDVLHSCADISVAREVLGYEPVVGFEEGIRATAEAARAAA